MSDDILDRLRNAHRERRSEVKTEFQRTLSFGDYFADRWERARFEGFGEGSSVYDNVLIIGEVTVGRHVWIGPNVVLDGSGGLTIGDHCSISAGVQIYTHHTVARSISLGRAGVDRQPTRIGNGVYIGPNSVVQMGIEIGDKCVIGALSFVNRNVPSRMMAAGSPARVIGPAPIPPDAGLAAG